MVFVMGAMGWNSLAQGVHGAILHDLYFCTIGMHCFVCIFFFEVIPE